MLISLEDEEDNSGAGNGVSDILVEQLQNADRGTILKVLALLGNGPIPGGSQGSAAAPRQAVITHTPAQRTQQKPDQKKLPEGWKLQKPLANHTKDKESTQTKEKSQFRVAPAGWSVQAVDETKLPSCAGGVALASSFQAATEIAARCAHCTAPLAILTDKALDGATSVGGAYFTFIEGPPKGAARCEHQTDYGHARYLQTVGSHTHGRSAHVAG